MEAKARFLGHAVHPMLVAFPIGLLTFVPVFDIVQIVTNGPLWAQIAFWLTVCGLLGALAAAIAGVIDWIYAVPRQTRAYRVGLTHMLINLIAVASYAVALVFRFKRDVTAPGYAPFAFDLIGVGVLLVGGWLGGELVQQHGMAVNPDAHPNAPSSLDQGRLVRRPSEPVEPMPV